MVKRYSLRKKSSKIGENRDARVLGLGEGKKVPGHVLELRVARESSSALGARGGGGGGQAIRQWVRKKGAYRCGGQKKDGRCFKVKAHLQKRATEKTVRGRSVSWEER